MRFQISFGVSGVSGHFSITYFNRKHEQYFVSTLQQQQSQTKQNLKKVKVKSCALKEAV